MLEKQLKKEYKELNDTCMNFLLKSQIAAVGLKLGFKLISIVRGSLVLEGKQLSLAKQNELKQIEGTYFANKKKISIPLNRIIDNDPELLFGQILDFIIN